MKKIIVASLIFLFFQLNNLDAQGVYKVVKTFHISSAGGWDYIAVGPGNKLYVSHGTQVNILDKDSGDSLGVILNTTGVHGIAFDEASGKGYTSNGRLNNVTVFDLKTNAVTGQIATGTNPDAIMYDAFSKRIITCNGGSNNLSIIDAGLQKVIATIPVGGKPETAVSDGAGKLYVNIEDKSEIAVVNLETLAVEGRWPIAPGESPTGLAIDKDTKRLFAGCEKQLIIVDASNGKLLPPLPIGDGCDGVVFDSDTKTVYTSNGEGTITVIKENSAADFTVAGTITTKKGARTITIDEATHALYLPTAEFEAGTPQGQRPKMIPGTFQVLVVH